MSEKFTGRLREELDGFRRDGGYKKLNHLDSPQAARVEMEGRGRVVILSSNNYVGMCDRPEVVEHAKTLGLETIRACSIVAVGPAVVEGVAEPPSSQVTPVRTVGVGSLSVTS